MHIAWVVRSRARRTSRSDWCPSSMIKARWVGSVRSIGPPASGSHRDAMGLQVRDDLQGLLADERAFVLSDHDRVEPAVRLGRREEQLRGVRSLVPGEAAGVANVEVFGHDLTMPRGQPDRLVVLPLPRRRRILVTVRGDPPVEGEA